jgi:MFS family permease
MFLLGGIMGMISVYMLARTPEPVSFLEPGHILKKIRKPLRDKNFRKLLFFNSFWSFSLNLATPFFSVFLLRNLHMGLSAIICLNILSQVSSILFVRVWGGYSDRFSNKTVIRICAPLYILCILGWTLAGHASLTFPLLILIHILSGITTAGINLSITNIGLKLAGKNDAIVYIAARNMLNAFIPALAPLLGGLLADHIDWKYFFVISAAMAFCSLRFLKTLKEEGEVGKGVAVNAMMSAIRLKLQRREVVEKRA